MAPPGLFSLNVIDSFRPDFNAQYASPPIEIRARMINALRASEAAAVRIEDFAETLRGHRVLHLVGKGNTPATMPITVPVLRVLEACRGERTAGSLILRPNSGNPIDRHGVHFLTAYVAGV